MPSNRPWFTSSASEKIQRGFRTRSDSSFFFDRRDEGGRCHDPDVVYSVRDADTFLGCTEWENLQTHEGSPTCGNG